MKVLATRQAPPAIENHAALLSTTFAHCPDGMMFIDPGYVIRAANDTAARQIGSPVDQIVGHPVEAITPSWTEQVGHIFADVRETGMPFRSMAFPFEFKDQTERGVTYWDLTVSPIYRAEECFLGCLLLLHEVTERERGEDAIRTSEANYRTIFDTANDAIFVHDLETGAILDVNQKMSEMYHLHTRRGQASHHRGFECRFGTVHTGAGPGTNTGCGRGNSPGLRMAG